MIRQLDRLLSIIEKTLITILTLAGLFMAFLQVLLRYVFNTGIHWLEAGLVTALIWAMLIGASRAAREGIHPRVDLVPLLVPPKVRAVFNFLALTSTLALILFFLWDSVFYSRFLTMLGVMHPELEVPQLYPFLIVPIMTTMLVLRYAMIIIKLLSDPSAISPDQHFRNQVSDPEGEAKP